MAGKMTRGIRRVAVAVAVVCGFFGGRPAVAERTSDYVRGGLVALWDGIENGGTSGAHLSGLSEWKDCVGDRAFSLTGVMTGDNHLSFTGVGTASYGDLSSADAAATFDLCAEGTVEIVLKCEGGRNENGLALMGTDASGMAVGWAGAHNCLLLSVGHDSQKCVEIDWFNATNTITILYSSAGVPLQAYANGEEKSFSSKMNNWGGGTTQAYVGRRSSGAEGFKGSIYCIRLYSRQLKAEEVAANAEVDRRRFIEGRTSDVDVTFQNVALNDADVIVAPNDGLALPATARFVSGLKPDLSDGVEVELGQLTGAEAAAFPVAFSRGAKTYCQVVIEGADGAVLRSLVRELPVPDFDSLSYVTDDLVAQWDGIENAGRDQHADALSRWTDLVGGKSFDFKGAVSVGENGIVFPGAVTAYGEMGESDSAAIFGVAATQDVTVEIALASADNNSSVVLQAPGRIAVGRNGQGTILASGSSASDNRPVLDWFWRAGAMNALSVMYSAEGSGDGFVNGGKGSFLPTENQWSEFGNLACLGGRQTHANVPFAGSVYAVRVYHRRLAVREIAENALVDRVRFAGDCDVADAMTVRIEYDGDGAACRSNGGLWPIPEGTVGCATERFVTDANGRTSTCLGWTLYVETGDDEWTEEAGGTGCSMSYQYDDKRRRLVWHTALSCEPPDSPSGVLVEGDPAQVGNPTIPYGWSQLEEGVDFELAEPNIVAALHGRLRVKSIACYAFDEQARTWQLTGRTRGPSLTATHTGSPTKYVLEWVPVNGFSVIVR